MKTDGQSQWIRYLGLFPSLFQCQEAEDGLGSCLETQLDGLGIQNVPAAEHPRNILQIVD